MIASSQILDQLYFDNFRQWKEDEERRRVEEEQHAGEGAPEGEGAVVESESGYAGRGRGRGGMGMRGRGRMGRGMMGRGPMMGMEGPLMMPMPMAPMFMPPGESAAVMASWSGQVSVEGSAGSGGVADALAACCGWGCASRNR